jgi:hypothetical protein
LITRQNRGAGAMARGVRTEAPCAMSEDPKVAALARDIETYVRARPHASDTIEGIRRWWLGSRWADASTPLMSAALETLLRSRVMGVRTQADGSTVYYAAREP